MDLSSIAARIPVREEQKDSGISARPVAALLVKILLPAASFLVPLLVWPGLPQPFSTPKIAVWCGAALLVAGASWAAGNFNQWRAADRILPLALLLAAIVGASAGLSAHSNLSSLILMFTAIGWFAFLTASEPNLPHLAGALAASASVIAILAILQYAGLDFFEFLGWMRSGGTNARMRVFSTLGNPNFVGAFLAGALPLTLALARGRSKPWLFAAGALQAFAIAATGSRAAAMGAIIGCAFLFAAGTRRRARVALLLVTGILVVGFTFAPVRSLGETIDGRFFVWRVSLPHLATIPLLGFGPGAFEPQFGLWQAHYFQAAVNAGDLRFAAPFDHAHNDLLEWTVEFGWAGLAALGACAALLFNRARKSGCGSSWSRGAAAGVLALACISLVDFPLHRPAELFLFTTLAAMAFLAESQQRGGGTN